MKLIQNYESPSRNLWITWNNKIIILDYLRKHLFKASNYTNKEILNYITAGFLLKVSYELNTEL